MNDIRWYAACAALVALPPAKRLRHSRQTMATYRRIAQLPPRWGTALDNRGAPLLVIRWVAWGPEPEERERRYRAALASWDERLRWPEELRATYRQKGKGRLMDEEDEEKERAPVRGRRRVGERDLGA